MDQIINFAKSAMEDKREKEQQGEGAYSGPGGNQAQQEQQQQGDYSQSQGTYGQSQNPSDFQQGGQQQFSAPSAQQGGFGSAQGHGQNFGGQNDYQQNQGGFQQGGQIFQQQGQGYQQQGQGQGNFGGNVQGGEQFDRPHGDGGASTGGGLASFFGGGGGQGPQLDQSAAVAAAQTQGGADSSLIGTAMSFLGGMNKQDADDLDEDDVMRKHDEAYNQQNASGMSANGLGAAAALQAFKKFTSGDPQAKQAEQGSGDMMSKLVGLAMGEAGSMFDKTGGTASGTKQDAVSSAGATIMKLLIKNQVSGMMGGGNSGGLGGMMSMASKFM